MSTLHRCLERHEIALGDQVEIGDQDCHGRIEPVALRELQAEAFLQVARQRRRADRSLAAFREPASTWVDAGAKIVGNVGEVAGEIARLVHHADQVLADHAVGGIGDVRG